MAMKSNAPVPVENRSSARVRMRVGLVAGMLAVSAPSLSAQVPGGTAAREGSSGIHFLAGGFAGRFDLDGGGQTDLFGGRAGVGLGQLVQITGFYWRGFDRSADSIIADNAWGGEVQLNLNSGFGITPFVTGGVARVHQDESADQTAAIAGAGLTFPLGPVLLNAGARDYMYGVTGLENDDSPENVTHNWLYSVGVTFALGSRRRRAAIAAAPPPSATDTVVLREANAELTALRDSLLAAGRPAAHADAIVARVAAIDSLSRRNYQSDRRIEIPIPTEGSITLRYGPEPAAASPIVVNAPASASQRAVETGNAAASGPLPVLPAGATLDAPATRAWLEQAVAQQVARQLAAEGARSPAASPVLTQAQLDALAQRVLDGVVASVLPQLDAAQARRMNDLRDDLRVALQDQRADVLDNVARTETVATPRQPNAAAAAPQQDAVAAIPAANVDVESVERTRSTARAAVTRAEAALRIELADVISAQSRFLTASETDRGPAAVLVDAAFERGAPLVSGNARPAIAAVAEWLRAHPDRRIYIHGHTDAVGTELANQRMSELRAEAVRSLLVQEGIESNRLFAVGYGQARPVADNATDRSRALNRRVEIVIGESRSVVAR